MISELTGLEVSNASLLDEASAAAESVQLALSSHNFKRNKFFISKNAFSTTISVVKSRGIFLDAEIIVGDENTYDFEANADQISGVLLQNPDNSG